ncbi:MAG: hypothetical protein MJ180_06150 [Candidatus Gastranaerophilales bacterium]|nr:hypothetical protein [Candidatus Gastranaerophilales bacterium]
MDRESIKKSYKGKVAEITKAANNLFYIKIKADNFHVKAGQFISVLCGDYTLRRPFSVMNFENDIITVLFKLKGKGTEYIKNLKVNDDIEFSGAFGNGFNIENKKSLIVAAGVGVAPVSFLKTTLDKNGIENRIIAGFLNKDNIPENINLNMISTDDGSLGKNGSIINYLDDEIKTYKPQKIYACGPSIVLKKVCEAGEKYNIEAEIAMEKEMACSIGVCRGCVIELKNGKNATVCKDGPVFKGSEIKWQ